MTITLTQTEFNLIVDALTEFSLVLSNRFEHDARYIHPALKYQVLSKKLLSFDDALPLSEFELTATPLSKLIVDGKPIR